VQIERRNASFKNAKYLKKTLAPLFFSDLTHTLICKQLNEQGTHFTETLATLLIKVSFNSKSTKNEGDMRGFLKP
jgi:hypothetical protein